MEKRNFSNLIPPTTAMRSLAGLLAALLAPAALGQFQYERLKSFGFPEQSAAYPNGIIEGSDGALYGTAQSGSTNNGGVVFKLNKDASGYLVLHHFTGMSADGSAPSAALIEASDGKLYGTTQYGGSNGVGTVFTLSKDGSGYMVLRSFTNSSGDGRCPSAALVESSDGALYGTTKYGEHHQSE